LVVKHHLKEGSFNMKWLIRAAVGVVAVIFIVVGVGFFLPRTISVERSVVVKAPQQTVFLVLNSLRAFQKWSPWAKLDPQMAVTFDGPDAGVGQKLSWTSKKRQLGTGSQTITASTPSGSVMTHVDFGKMGAADAGYTLAAADGGVHVSWKFNSDKVKGPIAPYFLLMAKGDVAKDYERGLANLKSFVEKLPKVDLTGFAPEHVQVAAQSVIKIRTSSAETSADMGRALGAAYAQLSQAIAAEQLEPAGPPLSMAGGVKADQALIDAAIPVKGTPASPLPEGVIMAKTYDGGALRVVHYGPYDGLTAVYPKLLAFALANGWDVAGSSWNEYVSDPARTAPEQIETRIYVPVK
jgi:effector-binding domain-containing protein